MKNSPLCKSSKILVTWSMGSLHVTLFLNKMSFAKLGSMKMHAPFLFFAALVPWEDYNTVSFFHLHPCMEKLIRVCEVLTRLSIWKEWRQAHRSWRRDQSPQFPHWSYPHSDWNAYSRSAPHQPCHGSAQIASVAGCDLHQPCHGFARIVFVVGCFVSYPTSVSIMCNNKIPIWPGS